DRVPPTVEGSSELFKRRPACFDTKYNQLDRRNLTPYVLWVNTGNAALAIRGPPMVKTVQKPSIILEKKIFLKLVPVNGTAIMAVRAAFEVLDIPLFGARPRDLRLQGARDLKVHDVEIGSLAKPTIFRDRFCSICCQPALTARRLPRLVASTNGALT
ncbi:hypothetical protein FOL46_001899, partial [Perkinsus olseni]